MIYTTSLVILIGILLFIKQEPMETTSQLIYDTTLCLNQCHKFFAGFGLLEIACEIGGSG